MTSAAPSHFEPGGGEPAGDLDVSIDDDRWLAALPDLDALAQETIECARAVAKGRGGEVSLLFADDRALRDLNVRHLGKDAPTNVLSFPAPSTPPFASRLGDIAFGFETVRSEAATRGRPLAHHARHLLVHGFLHLLGYDHDADDAAREMETLEARILARFGVPDPYVSNDGA